MELLFTLVGVLILPTLLYFVGSRSKEVWGLVRRGQVTNGTGLYRAAPTTVWAFGQAPLSVRVAAFTSFLLGQMIFPGALAAVGGFFAMFTVMSKGGFSLALAVIFLSAPTGLIVAGRLLGAGFTLLRRESRTVEKVRVAARWELWHNGVLFAGLVISALVGDEKECIACAVVAAPVLIALIHGQLLLRAARALEDYNAAQDAEPALPVNNGFAPAS